MFKIIFFIILKAQALELSPSDINAFFQIGRSPNLAELYQTAARTFPELKIVVLGEHPQWWDRQISKKDYENFKTSSDLIINYLPAFSNDSPMTLREHPRIVISSAADRADALFLILNYLVDRNRSARVPDHRAISYFDFLREQFADKIAAEPDYKNKFMVWTEEVFTAADLTLLSKAEISLFLIENRDVLKLSLAEILVQKAVAKDYVRKFQERIIKHFDSLDKRYIPSPVYLMYFKQWIKISRLDKQIKKIDRANACSIYLKDL